MELFYGGYIKIFQNKDYKKLFLINIFMTVLASMLAPVFPLWIMEVVDVSPSFVFFMLGAIGIGSSIVNIFIGHLTDLIGKRKLIIEVKIALQCLRALLFSFFPYTTVIIVASCLTQFSSSSLIFAVLADKIKDNNDEKNKGSINSTIRAGISLGYIVGPFIGISIVSLVSYYYFFIIYALLNIGLLIAIHFFINDSNKLKVKKNDKDKNNNIEKRRNYIGFILITLLPIFLFIGCQTNSTLLSLYVDSIAGKWMLALIFGVGPLFEIITFPIVGVLTDKFGTSKTVFLGILGEILYFIMLAMTTKIWIVIIVQIFSSFYVAVIFSSLMMYVQDQFKNRIGFSSSLYFSSMGISGTVGNILMGSTIMAKGYNTSFLILAVITSLGLLTFFILEYYKYYELKKHKTTQLSS